MPGCQMTQTLSKYVRAPCPECKPPSVQAGVQPHGKETWPSTSNNTQSG